jgi:branched-chain amino acid transport system ATP-binding protein
MSDCILEAVDLALGYGGRPVVRNLSMQIKTGEIVALLGPNGAGKSTTALGLAGVLTPTSGTLKWKGEATRARFDRRARTGTSFVREKRSIVSSLSVKDNLKLACSVDRGLQYFPELEAHLRRKAGLLSGGQQQMLELARALGREPQLLIADELSLGLAPLVVQRLFDALSAARERGVGVILIEQHARKALSFADRGYVLSRGEVRREGSAAELLDRIQDIESVYLSDGGARAAKTAS